MNPDIFRVYGSVTKRQQRALTKVFKNCTFDWTLLKRGMQERPGPSGEQHVTFKIEETGRWGALYYPDTKFIVIHPDTIGYRVDKGRMRIAVSSIMHELGHAVDHNCLTDEERAEIKASFKCAAAPCSHSWRDTPYLDRYTEAFADAFVAAYTPAYDEMRPIDRTHRFNLNTISTIRRVLA